MDHPIHFSKELILRYVTLAAKENMMKEGFEVDFTLQFRSSAVMVSKISRFSEHVSRIYALGHL